MSELKTKEVKLKNIEIKNLFDFLNKVASERGVSKEVTKCVLANLTGLEQIYVEVMSGVFNPETDQNVAKYKKEIQQLQLQFADKDEKGEIITHQGKLQITTNFADYEKAVKELNVKCAQVIQMINNAPAYNNQYMNNEREVKLSYLDSYPDETPPLLVYYLSK